MIIRRITLKLPPSMRRTAAHDARAIAEALALRADSSAPRVSLELVAQGRSGVVLGAALASRMPKGGSHGR